MDSKNFHFSALYRGDKYQAAYARHQHYLFSKLNLRPGMRVLEVGCGRGTAAVELATFANVSVVGIDSDASLIEYASRCAQMAGVSTRTSFAIGDIASLMHQFATGSFDAIYSIESLKESSTFQEIYDQAGSLLKNGGTLAVYEWCWTPTMDPLDINHIRLAEFLEDQTGVGRRNITQRALEEATKTIRDSERLDLVYVEDLACRRSTLPWYLPLDHALSDTRTRWAPDSRSYGAFGKLTRNAAIALSQAGHLKLFTPMVLLVARRV
ncbi:related to delta(24)-sterol c-methyltransferase (erg6) [Armillaria ostoyae]|uniref:Related to delta(24)-sterol c-methyltransferase (Erg6) n=1 Tax=Armillaria ostoyae TaxID=47428 RepID=A0A284RGW7_ARMOS|nr:related to delta(24)-sterol c-methyltransferase (erg6) [Armillaria ostoyae]